MSKKRVILIKKL